MKFAASPPPMFSETYVAPLPPAVFGPPGVGYAPAAMPPSVGMFEAYTWA
jgi:hypothetical protein